jgi:hypothetical protein
LDRRAVSSGGELDYDPAAIRMDAFGLDVLGIALMGEQVVVIEPVLADGFPGERDPDCYQREAAVDFDVCGGLSSLLRTPSCPIHTALLTEAD